MGGGYGPFIAHHRTRRKSTRLPFWVLYWVLYWVLCFACFFWVLFFFIWLEQPGFLFTDRKTK